MDLSDLFSTSATSRPIDDMMYNGITADILCIDDALPLTAMIRRDALINGEEDNSFEDVT